MSVLSYLQNSDIYFSVHVSDYASWSLGAGLKGFWLHVLTSHDFSAELLPITLLWINPIRHLQEL